MAERRAGYLQEVEGYYDTVQYRNDKVGQAARLVRERHKGQKRKESGLPYENHIWDCHRILTQELRIEDETMEAAVLLHDVVEDNHVTLDEIRKQFGDDVADLVGRLEKVITPEGARDDMKTVQRVVSLDNGNGGEIYNQQEAESMFVKALILKLVDRLSNMRDIPKTDAKERKATETLEIYVELAEALGMWEVKKELEDLAYADLHPEEYHRIKDAIDNDPRRSETFQNDWSRRLQELAENNDVEAKVEVREASIRHIEDKLDEKAFEGHAAQGEYDKVNDATSFRLIVNSKKDIKDMSDFLMEDPELGDLVITERIDYYTGSRARPNGYQAIQITLGTKEGEIEIALVTKEMEEFNQWGMVSKIRSSENDLEAPKIMFVNGRPRFMREKEATGIDLNFLVNGDTARFVERMLVNDREMDLGEVVPHGANVVFEMNTDPEKAINMRNYHDIALRETKEKMEQLRSVQETRDLIAKGEEMLLADFEKRGVLIFRYLEPLLVKYMFEKGHPNIEKIKYLVGKGSLRVSVLSKWLDKQGATKDLLGCSSIVVTGKDQKKILKYVSGKIGNLGGNIEEADIDKDGDPFDVIKKEGNQYTLTILTRGLNRDAETQLMQQLINSGKFESVRVV